MTQGARVWLHLLTRDVQRALAARVPYGMRGTTPPARTSEPPGGPGDSLAMLTLPSLGAPAGGTPHSHAVQRICYTLNATRCLTARGGFYNGQ